jgi:hypothetical protein
LCPCRGLDQSKTAISMVTLNFQTTCDTIHRHSHQDFLPTTRSKSARLRGARALLVYWQGDAGPANHTE